MFDSILSLISIINVVAIIVLRIIPKRKKSQDQSAPRATARVDGHDSELTG
jgi:hypothetical protein